MMTPATLRDYGAPAGYRGLRMTAEEFLEIPDDGFSYELINGVVIMSPSPTPRHQAVAGEIFTQIALYLRSRSVGQVLAEIDVHLGQDASGRDIVYKPEVVFVTNEHWGRTRDLIEGPPALVVEVISRGSRQLDSQTKKADYERFGVREYWLIDPETDDMHFYRLVDENFIDAPASGDRFISEAVPDFTLDLARIRKVF